MPQRKKNSVFHKPKLKYLGEDKSFSRYYVVNVYHKHSYPFTQLLSQVNLMTTAMILIRSRNLRLRVLLLIAVMLVAATCFAQQSKPGDNNDSKNDTNKIVKVNYPPLTTREGLGIQLFLPPPEHPRLFLRQKDIQVLKENSQHPLLKNCWSRIVQASGLKTDVYLPIAKDNNNTGVRDAIEAKALMYLFYRDKTVGAEAVNEVLHYLATLKIDQTKPDVTRETGRAIVTGAIVYDWCYPLLSPKQKDTLIGRMETLATTMEIQWPQIKGSSIDSHTVEAQLSRDMLSLAIAVYDENPEIYKRITGRIFAEFIPARHFYYPAGYHHQGSAYGAYRFNWEMFATFIFDRMGYPNLYGEAQANVPYYFIYDRRPDGQMMRNGDDYTEQSTPFGKWWNLGQGVAFLAGSYHKDPVVLNEAFKERSLRTTADYLFEFLFFDPKAVGAATKASLPLTKYFDKPYGAMTARTAWEDGIKSNDVIAQMKVNVYNFANHQHLDAGSFQLYYKGPLAVQSGIYQGTTGTYGGEHFKNYSQRTIAHNTMLVYNANEQFTWQGKKIINDGGQQYPNEGHEPENMDELLSKGYKTAEVLAHGFGPDSVKPAFTYLKGELADAYPGKVKSFKRSFVFLNLDNDTIPAALIVYDNLHAADKTFKKYWLLHCVEEPSVNSIYTTIARTEKGYHGKMINTTLLPQANNLIIEKIGGSGNEYNVFGKNFPQSMVHPASSSSDSAVWRIQVSPKIAEANNQFLNVMQVMNADFKPASQSLPIPFETNKLTGAKIGNRLVLFSKTGDIIAGSFKLSIKGNDLMKVLITDVKVGNWKITSANKKEKVQQVKNTSQLLYFMLKPGEYIISKQVGRQRMFRPAVNHRTNSNLLSYAAKRTTLWKDGRLPGYFN